MGGAVSCVEELVATTILIGSAISAMSFPGMYRIYDFQSKNAPNSETSNNEDKNSENERDRFFIVTVGGDEIFLDDPLCPNEAGWTPLHSCCTSFSTVQAGMSLVDETLARGGSLETKTLLGPGTFNHGWTPLQMACAYGIDPLVEKLVNSGANVNSTNCYGYSCLLEACHRGYADIVKYLLRGKIDIDYVPDVQKAVNSPFISAPCQTALGEACRCGFYKIAQMLIDAGADKNRKNYLGWTPLHEACFYHRIETVKTLLLNGSDPIIRTNLGALPYHLTGLQEIKTMLESMGGSEAVPQESDVIDMVQVLTELTLLDANEPVSSSSNNETVAEVLTSSSKVAATSDRGASDSLKIAAEGDQFLHSGRSLGNLPHLKSSSPTKLLAKEMNEVLSNEDIANKRVFGSHLSRGAESKQTNNNTDPSDAPKQYLCELTRRLMTEPVKTIYGNVYDKEAILNWFSKQGRICPLTGAPLAETDLVPLPELEKEIRQFILRKSLQQENDRTKGMEGKSDADDLYEF